MDSTTPLHFAHYEVRRREDGSPWELGRGAMGVTYKARDPQLRVDVALKVINPAQVGDAKAKALFLREARAAARVHHANVGTVVYLNQDPENMFYAMEFIAGESLRDWLHSRVPLPPSMAIELSLQIARGLEAIHREEVIHRDLKPTNLMMLRADKQRPESDPEAWQIKIIDFGLARNIAGEVSESAGDAVTTGFRGTALYASPEQCEERRDLDGRSDLYSLGCVMWEMLVGASPFRANAHRELLNAHVAKPPPLAQLSHLPAGLQTVVARLMAKDREARFADAGALIRALEKCRELIAKGGSDGQPSIEKSGRVEEPTIHLPATPMTTRRWLRPILAAWVVVAASVTIGYLTNRGRQEQPAQETGPTVVPAEVAKSTGQKPDAVTTVIPEKSIAVLPFENLSSDKENEYFADGVHDEVLTDLSRIADLKVTSRTSVMRYRGTKDRGLREIARDLGVSYVLEGTVQRVGGKVRVTAQLIDARTDAHVWAERYDRDLQDVFAIQSELAGAIAAQLKAKLTPAEKEALGVQATNDVAAYDLYLRAKALHRDSPSMMLAAKPEMHLEAAKLLDQAVARDPKYVAAYCLQIQVYDALARGAPEVNQKAYRQKAADALAAALKIAPESGEVMLAEAQRLYFGEARFAEARALITRALQKLPNNPEAWALLGRLNYRQGHWEEGYHDMLRAYSLDPSDIGIIEQCSFFAIYLRRYDERIAFCSRGAALTSPPKRWAFEIRGAATEYFRSGDNIPIEETQQRILRENPGRQTEIDLAEHIYLTALTRRDPDAMERAMELIVPGKDKWGKMESMNRQIQLARIRGNPEVLRGLLESAVATGEAALANKPNDGNWLERIAYYYALLGRKDEAVLAGRRAYELVPIGDSVLHRGGVVQSLSRVYALTGEKALAIAGLEELASLPSHFHYGDLVADPFDDWRALRHEPRFQALVAKMAPK